MTSSPVTAWQIEGEKVEGVTDFLFLGRWWLQPWNQKTIASWQESDDKPKQCVEKQRHYSADKGPYSQAYGLPSGHTWLSELDRKEGRTSKNWCLRTVVPWTTRWNQSILREINLEYSLEGMMLKLKLQYFSHLNRWLIGKVPDAGKDWGQKEKRASEDEMVGCYHWLNGHEFEQVPGVANGQGGLVCCSSWGHKESDMAGWLNNNNICVCMTDSLYCTPETNTTL